MKISRSDRSEGKRVIKFQCNNYNHIEKLDYEKVMALLFKIEDLMEIM